MQRVGIIKAGGMAADAKLYRYINLSQFLDFVENQRVHLTRIKDWEDPWEAPGSSLPVENDDGKLTYPSWNLSEDLYGQSWTLNPESDALWRIYSPQGEGLLIQTSAEKFSLLTDIKFGQLAPVMYFEDLIHALNTLTKTSGYDTLFSEALLKRKAFEHEQEVRLITINDERCLPRRFKRCSRIYVGLDPFVFIEGITVDPRAHASYVETLAAYCKRAGFSIVPTKSSLYSPDIYGCSGVVRKYVPVKQSG
jgi:hypothetical protein